MTSVLFLSSYDSCILLFHHPLTRIPHSAPSFSSGDCISSKVTEDIVERPRSTEYLHDTTYAEYIRTAD